ncbi:MAG: hypothetical protein ACLFU8_05065 [Anaerolineales bacterium]
MTIFLTAFFWEFVQNLPVLLGFAAAVWWWAQGERGKAVAVCVLGGLVGAVVIRYTEAWKIGRPFMEPWSVTLVNVAGFALFTFLGMVYTGSETRWSSWRTDLLLGALIGGGFALAQGLAFPGAPLIGILLHSLALATAGAVVLLMMRRAKARTLTAALINALLVTLVMTAIITVIDYSYLLIGLEI